MNTLRAIDPDDAIDWYLRGFHRPIKRAQLAAYMRYMHRQNDTNVNYALRRLIASGRVQALGHGMYRHTEPLA